MSKIKTDQPQATRAEDALDEDKIVNYLKQILPEMKATETVEILQFPGGASNLTYQVEFGNQTMILRTAPRGANIKGAHDMGREFNVLSRLQGHFPYCPKPIAYSDDETVLGRPFYLMEKVEGLIPRQQMPAELSKQENRILCENLVSIHATLHAVDINKTGLIELGKPQGYVSRQVSGWCGRYEKARTEDVPKGKTVMNWLLDNQPDDSYSSAEQASFIHNDYKFDNVVLDSKNPTEIISVLDWEMATIGDPLMDLGCSMAYWIEANDSAEMHMIRMMPTHLEGMMTREQVVDFYIQKSGKDIANFNYYYVFGMFRLAVIAQQIYKRYKEGKTTNKKFAILGKFCSILIMECKKYI
jgi:aminoglycoside phosphotransferase (APT) family kinase protein